MIARSALAYAAVIGMGGVSLAQDAQNTRLPKIVDRIPISVLPPVNMTVDTNGRVKPVFRRAMLTL